MVYVGELDDGERNSVISWMSYLYGCGGCVSYDSNMFLTLDTKGLSASVLEANWWLTEAITSTSYFANIKPRNKNKKVAFAKNQGPIDSVLWNETMKPADQILVDFDDVQYLMGDQQAIDTWLATLIPHEIRHRFPQMYTVPDDLRGTGPIVDAVNIMTDKLGLPHRMKYAAQVRNGIAEIPYTLKQVDRNGNSKENLLFLRWDQEKTGKGGK
jgi:hypothetical protein